MFERTGKGNLEDKEDAVMRLIDAGVKPGQLASYDVFGKVYVFSHGSLLQITPKAIKDYNEMYRSEVLAAANA